MTDNNGVHPVNDIIIDPAEYAQYIYTLEGFDDITPKAAQAMALEDWIEQYGFMYSEEVLEELRFLVLY